jgi:hypothetical protein
MPFEEKKFSSPAEEIAWLEQKLLEKKAELEKKGEMKEFKELIEEVLGEYEKKFPETPEYKLPEEEVEARVFELKPEPHDRQIEELLGMAAAKGILNAVSICRKIGNPHLEDDFHRVLVQYLVVQLEKAPISKGHLFRALNMILYEVSLPQEEVKEEKTFKDFISPMEQFYSGMAAICEKEGFHLWPRPKPYFVLEIAVPNIGEEITFYASVPRDKNRIFEKQLLAVFPKAQLREKKDDYNIFNFMGASVGAVAQLKTNQIFPIKIYKELNVDPLEVVGNAFSKLKKEGEGLALQIVISPEKNSLLQKIRSIINELKKGESLKDVLKAEAGLAQAFFKALADIFSGVGAPPSSKEPLKREIIADENIIKLLERKAEHENMLVNIRLIASAGMKTEAKGLLDELKGAFLQFNEPNGNSFVFKDLEGKQLEKLFYNFSFRIFNPKDSFYLNTVELSTVFHFPVAISAPKVKYLKAKDAPPPLNLPEEGLLLGKNIYRDEETPVYIADDDRRRHLYLVGQTGTGKSVLMQNLIIQDIKAGRGVCMIDPHGDAVKEILARIPQSRIEDVIYFDPADISRPMGLNMLEYDPSFPEQKIFVVNELLDIFHKLYGAVPEAMGPAFEQYFRNSTLLVMEDPSSGNTLLDVQRVFADKEFRAYKLSHCSNPTVKSFWMEIAEKATGEQALANYAPYITNKFDTFLSNEIMRPIVCQERSAFNFRQVMDEGKILLINLSKGRLGDLNSALLGLIIVGKIFMAALSRTDLAENERRDFYLYIDEFQNVTTKSIAQILAEARKYRLNLVIAHQFIGQLDEDIKKAVFGNVGSMIIFRVGADDAPFLEKQVEPVFNSRDLLNIDNFNAYLNLLIGGQTSRPFNIKTVPFGPGNPNIAESAKNLSRLKYGRPKEEIEAEIRKKYVKEIPAILEK